MNNSLLLIILTIFFFSCNQNKNKSEGIPDKHTSKTVNSISHEKDLSSNSKPGDSRKIITYNDLVELDKFKPYNYGLLYGTRCFKYMFPEELRLLRNEIFARHGYIFKDKELKVHFSAKSWYTPKYETIDSISLDKFHTTLVDSILKYEKQNKNVSEEDFRQELKLILKSSKFSRWERQAIPIALFNRFMPEEVRNIFSEPVYYGGFLLEYLDTLASGDKIVMGCYSSMCPAETCYNEGVIIVCDTNLYYIDSEPVYGENLRIKKLSEDSLELFYYPYEDEEYKEYVVFENLNKIREE